MVQNEFRGIADPDQSWILGELIRYVKHPRSATEFDDLSDDWVTIGHSVVASTLRANALFDTHRNR